MITMHFTNVRDVHVIYVVSITNHFLIKSIPAKKKFNKNKFAFIVKGSRKKLPSITTK